MDLLRRSIGSLLAKTALLTLVLSGFFLLPEFGSAQESSPPVETAPAESLKLPEPNAALTPPADATSLSTDSPSPEAPSALSPSTGLDTLPQSLSHGPVTAAIDEIGTETLLLSVVLESEQPGTGFKSLMLENPLRLVVDVNGVTVAGTRVFELIGKGQDPNSDKPYRVSSIRMGGHPDKIRVVFDIRTESAKPALSLQGEIQGARKSLKISLSTPDLNDLELSSSVVKPDEKPVAAVAGSTEVASPVATQAAVQAMPTQIAVQPPEEPKNTTPAVKLLSARRSAQRAPAQPIALPTTAVEVAPALPSIPAPPLATIAASSLPSTPVGSNTLKGFSFTQIGAENLQVLKIHLNNRPSFTLSRKDEVSYLLFLPNFNLENPRVGLAHFPPAEFLGLTMIKAAAVQDGVEVTIVVERGVKLATSSSENEILVRAVQ